MGEDQRKNPRSKTYAKVQLTENGTLGYLRDLSREGCQLAFVADPRINDGAVVRIEILPAEEMEILPFTMDVQIMWTREDPVYHRAGGLITAAQNEDQLKKLYKYYS